MYVILRHYGRTLTVQKNMTSFVAFNGDAFFSIDIDSILLHIDSTYKMINSVTSLHRKTNHELCLVKERWTQSIIILNKDVFH